MEENANTSGMSMSKNMWIWAIIIVIIVLGLIFWATMTSNNPASTTVIIPPSSENTATQTPTTIQSTEDISSGSIHSGSTTAAISYANALIKYANARLQLDDTCEGSPAAMTFRNNAYLMIDNRAPVARTVKVGTTFSIKAYSFKIIELSSAKLPATWLVDCDQSQNVATILLQK